MRDAFSGFAGPHAWLLSVRELREIRRVASYLQPPSLDRFSATASTVGLPADAIEWKDTWCWHKEQVAEHILDPQVLTGWRHAPNCGIRGKTWDALFVHADGLERSWMARNRWKREQPFDGFVANAYEYAKSSVPQYGKLSTSSDVDESSAKKPRVAADFILPLTCHESRLEPSS